MAKITKEMLIADALQCGNREDIAKVLKGYGMHCFGCALARGESIEDAANAHGVDVEEMLLALNAVAL